MEAGRDREISVGIEDDDDDERARSSFSIVRSLNKLGPKEWFQAFAVFSTYYERKVAENNTGADQNNEAQIALGGG